MVATIGFPGTRKDTSYTTNSKSFVITLWSENGPIVATTSPYTKYQYGKTFGVGRRIAMEIKRAQEEDRLDEIVT